MDTLHLHFRVVNGGIKFWWWGLVGGRQNENEKQMQLRLWNEVKKKTWLYPNENKKNGKKFGSNE